MTREEAIKSFENENSEYRDFYKYNERDLTEDERQEINKYIMRNDMAISALSAEEIYQ